MAKFTSCPKCCNLVFAYGPPVHVLTGSAECPEPAPEELVLVAEPRAQHADGDDRQ